MLENPAIVVFARHPTPGRVKTRLAAGVGPDHAAIFYRHCAEFTIKECLKMDSAVYIFISAAEEEAQAQTWLAPLPGSKRLILKPQVDSPNLGDRLAAAMQYAISAGHRRVAVIGTDVPDLSSSHLKHAFHALGTYDAVFGPSEDGGYYLFAIKGENTLPQGIFNNIDWSTAAVLEQNASNVTRLGLHLAPLDTLPTLMDIDTPEDLRGWIAAVETRREKGQEAGSGATGVWEVLKVAKAIIE